MSFGLVALIVVCGWSLLSIVTSFTFGAMADGRDAEPHRPDGPLPVRRDVGARPETAPRQRHLAS